MAGSYCKKCGAQLGETAWYCKICGAPTDELLVSCPACGKETSAGGGFCQSCGARLEKTPAADARELSRLRLKYHPLWIPVAALLATLSFLAAARFLWQLQSGAFPREGVLWSALLLGAFACAAFYGGRALLIAAEGFQRGEYAAAKKEDARLQRSGRGKKRNGFSAFLRARPLAAALALFTCIALCASLLLPPAAEPAGAAAGQPEAAADTPAAPGAPADGAEGEALPENGGEALRLKGAWWNFSDQWIDYVPVINFICISGDTALTGTCSDTAQLKAYLKSGVISDSMTVNQQYTYVVKETAFLEVNNIVDEDYLYNAVIEMYDAGGSLASTWDLDALQSLTMRDPEDPLRYDIRDSYQSDELCAYSFVPAQGEATTIVSADPPKVWGVWVSIADYEDYTQLNYHNKADIPYVFFLDDGVLYKGNCTGAKEMLDLIMSLPAMPENMDAYEGSFTTEDAVYTLKPDMRYPMVDSCRIHVTLKPGEKPVLWEMGTGSILYTDDGGIYYWGEGIEWSAMR